MNKLSNFIVLADNDGTIRDTNSVKDECLNAFCVAELGAYAEGTLPTEVHHRMLGIPMAAIFVQIAQECYGKVIDINEGQKITERLNEFIRPEYVARKVYDGARDFYQALKDMGLPMYILTGMEPDLVEEGLRKHGMAGIFDEILGAPKTKEENIAAVLKKHPGSRILAMGDALSEYKATMAYPGTIFLAFDFENRKERVFPNNVNVLTQYNRSVWDEIISQIKGKPLF